MRIASAAGAASAPVARRARQSERKAVNNLIQERSLQNGLSGWPLLLASRSAGQRKWACNARLEREESRCPLPRRLSAVQRYTLMEIIGSDVRLAAGCHERRSAPRPPRERQE